MTTIRYTGDELWDRIERSVEKVKDRLQRVATHAIAAWGPFDIWPATARWLSASAGGGLVAVGASLMAVREQRRLAPWLELKIEG